MKLKPCPFCDGKAKPVVACSTIWIECVSVMCGVEGPRVHSEDRSAYPSADVERAAELWNERPGISAEVRAIDSANRRMHALRYSDGWLESALLQLLHENGIEPPSSMLIEALKRAGLRFE